MPRKTQEDQDIENLIRGQAIQAQQWQAQITADEDLERWCGEGHWTYLRAKVLDVIERRAFLTIKNPAFDVTNINQISQWKALCQIIDLIEAEINQRLATVQDARMKLRDLEMSTPKEE